VDSVGLRLVSWDEGEAVW